MLSNYSVFNFLIIHSLISLSAYAFYKRSFGVVSFSLLGSMYSSVATAAMLLMLHAAAAPLRSVLTKSQERPLFAPLRGKYICASEKH